MKKFLALLIFALLACHADAQVIITATVTVTNTSGTVNGNTIAVNGNTRLWTNNATVVNTQIATTNTITAAAQNLFLSYVIAREANLSVAAQSTNAVLYKSFPGSTLTVTVGGTWGNVTYSTNTITDATVVRVPRSVFGNGEQTNIESGLIDYIGDNKSTNTVPASAPSFVNYANISLTQTITGTKTFSSLNGTVGGLTNGVYLNPVLTNGQNYGSPFRSPGTAANSENFGANSLASDVSAAAFGYAAKATGPGSTSLGTGAIATGTGSTALGNTATATGVYSLAIGSAVSSNIYSAAIGFLAVATNDYSTAIGQAATTTANHQMRFGTGAEFASIPGGLQVEGSITNSHWTGTNTLDGDISFIRKNNSSLANGANAAVDCSTNVYVKLSGPSGAFTLNGIAGGRDGRQLILQNSTGFTMTIANDSGVDPTAANRIKTNTGADVVNASNPGTVMLIYDTSVSRWILLNSN